MTKRINRLLSLLGPIVLGVVSLGTSECGSETDEDLDGWTIAAGDCDDFNPDIHPGADELCNGRDDDCDGHVDDGVDVDQDGWSGCDDDCDDNNPAIHPQALDGCDGADTDCDGEVDEDGEVDADQDGWTTCNGDCDDADPRVHPGAPEACNGADDDCDGVVDQSRDGGLYFDHDGDGFGFSEAGCSGGDLAVVPARGDCDDNDPSVYPGAEDVDDDQHDSDCGGTDASDPHVGLSSGSLEHIRDALSAAQPGVTIWVGRGTYFECGLSFQGKAINLVSTHKQAATIVDAQGGCPGVFRFVSGETPDAVLDGFTLQGGSVDPDYTSWLGGGISIYGSSPTLRNLVITGNNAYGSWGKSGDIAGGGVYAEDSETTLENVVITGNHVYGGDNYIEIYCSFCSETGHCEVYNDYTVPYGGGLYADRCRLTLRNVVLSDNSTAFGGGAFFRQSEITYEGGAVLNNVGYFFVVNLADVLGCGISYYDEALGGLGGGLYLESSTLTMSRVSLSANRADDSGAAIYAHESTVSLLSSRLSDNEAESDGGGLRADSSTLSLDTVALLDNEANSGGGIYGRSSELSFTHTTLAGNRADLGGGLYAYRSQLTLSNSVLAYNIGGDFITSESPDCTISSCALYNPDSSHNLNELPAGTVTEEPAFLEYDSEGRPVDVHLALDSPLIDVGEGGVDQADPDGSAPDIGAYGGPNSDGIDLDQDGYPDYYWPGGLAAGPSSPALFDYDCDDDDPVTHPFAEEVCDGRDNDCDGAIDEGWSPSSYYPDRDGDGYGQDAGAVFLCAAPAGYVGVAGDCDDDEPLVHPGAPQRCDGQDDDCDGQIEAGELFGQPILEAWYQDLDADGFGDPDVSSCEPQTGFVAARGDCGDDDPSVHPGAEDVDGDGVDRDCGGRDAPDPHVGLSSFSASSINAALAAAEAGTTIWVGPGTWLEYGLYAEGKSLRSTHGASSTTIDAQGQGTVIGDHLASTTPILIDGFTITGGYMSGGYGAGVAIGRNDLILRGCIIRDNIADARATVSYTTYYGSYPDFTITEADALGGGVYVGGETVVIENCLIADNQVHDAVDLEEWCDEDSCNEYYGCYCITKSAYADGSGAGLYSVSASVHLKNTAFSGNLAQTDGGALEAVSSEVHLDHVRIEGNKSDGSGGGICMSQSEVTAAGSWISGNTASRGGGLYATNSVGQLENVLVSGNQASYGGGLYASASPLELHNCAILENHANSYGGALYVSDLSLPTIRNSVLTGNTARYQAGGVYVANNASPTLEADVLAYNTPSNIYLYSGSVNVRYSVVYNPTGENHNLTSIEDTNLEVDPGFLEYDDAGLPSDLHLTPDSPLIDAGPDRALEADADGSRNDVGVYGGPGGATWDRDGDGVFDYYWPGTIDMPPAGVSASDRDCDDQDPEVRQCG